MIRVALCFALPSALLCLGLTSSAPSKPMLDAPPADDHFATGVSLVCGGTLQGTIPAGGTVTDGPYDTREDANAARKSPEVEGKLQDRFLDEFFSNVTCAPCPLFGCVKWPYDVDQPGQPYPDYYAWVEENADGTWSIVVKQLGPRVVACTCTPCGVVIFQHDVPVEVGERP